MGGPGVAIRNILNHIDSDRARELVYLMLPRFEKAACRPVELTQLSCRPCPI